MQHAYICRQHSHLPVLPCKEPRKSICKAWESYLAHLQQTKSESRQEWAEHFRVTTFSASGPPAPAYIADWWWCWAAKGLCTGPECPLVDSELSMRPHINEVSGSVRYHLRCIWTMQPVPRQCRLMATIQLGCGAAGLFVQDIRSFNAF